ncbi:Zinc finger CCCH domain-containing protein 18 [Euphorbia peplus]|nr:Zinc finger CCCH domain-containing protein 18 [Euphorbia peplus]
MDFSESTKVVYNRIQKLEPENVSKIIGYLLLQDHGEREMIRLAFSPDNLIYSLITKAKSHLGLNKPPVSGPISPSPVNSTLVSDISLQYPYSPTSLHPVSSPAASRRAATSYWDAVDQQQLHSLEFGTPGYSDSLADQMQLLSFDDQLEYANSDFSNNYFYPEPALGPRTSRRSPSLPELPFKTCHYFNKGFCKHGASCRFYHENTIVDNFSQMFNLKQNDFANDEQVVSPGSLEKLERELTELLKSRRGMPVSIASLPMMYYEKYGRSLQAEGYLTESQRHGKAGYSLTKLLARLRNSIHVIDRPHGQHSVILAEDVPKYLEYIGERSDPGGIVAGSRQIYLTFPAESTFTEQDVSNYFSKFGPVQDVRIPSQHKRMFGFVTFVFVETVKQILAKGNPHFVCGARVLVKPYREKSRLVDRKYGDKIQHPMYYSPHFIDGDSEFHVPRMYDNSRLLRKQLMEEHEHQLELDRRRLSEFQLTSKSFNNHSYFGYSMDEWKFADGSAEQADFPSAERFNHLLDVLNNEDKPRRIIANYTDQDSQGLDLPESPFAPTTGSGISTNI